MNNIEVIGTLSLLLAFSYVFLALPGQIKKNMTERRSGMPILLPILAFAGYTTRLIYAFLIDAPYIWIPDSVGALLSAVLIAQYFRYRR